MSKVKRIEELLDLPKTVLNLEVVGLIVAIFYLLKHGSERNT